MCHPTTCVHGNITFREASDSWAWRNIRVGRIAWVALDTCLDFVLRIYALSAVRLALLRIIHQDNYKLSQIQQTQRLQVYLSP